MAGLCPRAGGGPHHTGATRVNTASRMGILGGTFDPIHFGHLDVAAAARRSLELTEVVFVPSRTPPHRSTAPIASGYHRFAMVALAVADESAYRVGDQELRAGGPSYTSVTLERHARAGVRASQLFFIIGADAFAEISSWHDYPNVLNLANFVVVSRPSHPISALRRRLPDLASRMRDAWTDVDQDSIPGETWVWLVDAETRDVSSSGIRTRLAHAKPIDQHVPPAVAAYLEHHQIYGAGATDSSLHD